LIKQKRQAQFDKTAFEELAFTPKRLKRAPVKLPSLPQDLLLLSSQDYNSQSKAEESESEVEIVEKNSDSKKLNITTANNYINGIQKKEDKSQSDIKNNLNEEFKSFKYFRQLTITLDNTTLSLELPKEEVITKSTSSISFLILL
ncbi:hypothetical protein DL98DRAFT_520025, partial [Cadophora sp. DSE1049]